MIALHEEQLAEHGGGTGIRDRGLLQSALARPRNAPAYAAPSVERLAAAYLFGIAKNHPFVDGNKRTAAVCALLFFRLNGRRFHIEEAELVVLVLAVAAGELGEEDVAAWLAERLV